MYYFKTTLLIITTLLVTGCGIASSDRGIQCNQIDSYSPEIEFDLHVSIDQLKIAPECYMHKTVTVQGILRGDDRGFYLFDQESSVKYYDSSKVIELDSTEKLATYPVSDISNKQFIWVRVIGRYAAPSYISDISSIEVLDSRY